MPVNLTMDQRTYLRLLIEERLLDIEKRELLLEGKVDPPGCATIEFCRKMLEHERNQLSEIFKQL